MGNHCVQYCLWDGGPGLCEKADWVSQEKQASEQLSSVASTSSLGFPKLWHQNIGWNKPCPAQVVFGYGFYHINRKKTRTLAVALGRALDREGERNMGRWCSCTGSQSKGHWPGCPSCLHPWGRETWPGRDTHKGAGACRCSGSEQHGTAGRWLWPRRGTPGRWLYPRGWWRTGRIPSSRKENHCWPHSRTEIHPQPQK